MGTRGSENWRCWGEGLRGQCHCPLALLKCLYSAGPAPARSSRHIPAFSRRLQAEGGAFTYSQGVWLRGACSVFCVTILSILGIF